VVDPENTHQPRWSNFGAGLQIAVLLAGASMLDWLVAANKELRETERRIGEDYMNLGH
jgi:hypothetical protein